MYFNHFCSSVVLPRKKTISAVVKEPELLHGGFLLCKKLLSCALVDVGAVGRGAECAARINGHEQAFANYQKLKKKKKKLKYFEVVFSTFTAAATLTLRIRVKTDIANKKTFQSRPTACNNYI